MHGATIKNGNKFMYKFSYEIDRTQPLCYTLYKGKGSIISQNTLTLFCLLT